MGDLSFTFNLPTVDDLLPLGDLLFDVLAHLIGTTSPLAPTTTPAPASIRRRAGETGSEVAAASSGALLLRPVCIIFSPYPYDYVPIIQVYRR